MSETTHPIIYHTHSLPCLRKLFSADKNIWPRISFNTSEEGNDHLAPYRFSRTLEFSCFQLVVQRGCWVLFSKGGIGPKMTHGTLCEEVHFWIVLQAGNRLGRVLVVVFCPAYHLNRSPKQGFLETFEQGQYQIKCALQDHFQLALSSKLVKTLLCFVVLPIINEI